MFRMHCLFLISQEEYYGIFKFRVVPDKGDDITGVIVLSYDIVISFFPCVI